MLAQTPDVYQPSIDETTGDYIDKLPQSHEFIPTGIKCPCTNKNYLSRQKMLDHVKTRIHKEFINELNKNRANHLVECHKLRELVDSQKLIIAKMEIEISKKKNTIDCLLAEIVKQKQQQQPQQPEIDLLSF